MQSNSLSGSSAQAQAGTTAADSQQLPELPALEGKAPTQTHLQQSSQDKQRDQDANLLQTLTKTKLSLCRMPTGSSQVT